MSDQITPEKDKITVISLTSSSQDLSDTVDKLKKACDKIGVDFYPVLVKYAYVDDVTASDHSIKIRNYDGSGKDVVIDPKNTVCFARGGITNTQIGLAILSIFENTGMFVINERHCMELCANKLATSIELDRYGIRTPKTAFVANQAMIDVALEKIGNKFPVIIKTLTGAEGVGVSRVDSYESLKSVLQSLWKYDAEVIIQEYLNITNDVRTLVLDGKVIGAAKRDKAPKDFRTNLAQGSKGGPYILSEDEKKIAIAASKALGCYYVGVDSVVVNNKPYIIELNASPGSGNTYRSYFPNEEGENLTGQQLIDKILRYVIKKENWVYTSRQAGVVEKIKIQDVGIIDAKLDTGNESYNVIHAENVKEGDGTVSFLINGKQYSKKVESHVLIRTSSMHTERRPVVGFDVTFRNVTYKNTKFSLTNRENNKYSVLMGLKFLQTAHVSVNSTKQFELPDMNESFTKFLVTKQVAKTFDEKYKNNKEYNKLKEISENYKKVLNRKQMLIESLDYPDNYSRLQEIKEDIKMYEEFIEGQKNEEYRDYSDVPCEFNEEFEGYIHACYLHLKEKLNDISEESEKQYVAKIDSKKRYVVGSKKEADRILMNKKKDTQNEFKKRLEARRKKEKAEREAKWKQQDKENAAKKESFETEDDMLLEVFELCLEDSTIMEASPPGGSAKRFSEKEDIKKDFKNRYGKKWKEVFYATAWKHHNKEKQQEQKEEVFDVFEDKKDKTPPSRSLLTRSVENRRLKTWKRKNKDNVKKEEYNKSNLMGTNELLQNYAKNTPGQENIGNWQDKKIDK